MSQEEIKGIKNAIERHKKEIQLLEKESLGLQGDTPAIKIYKGRYEKDIRQHKKEIQLLEKHLLDLQKDNKGQETKQGGERLDCGKQCLIPGF